MKAENKEIFKSAIANMMPGYLAIFNLADIRSRNDYFGHQKVDEEIAKFTELLCSSIDYANYGMRIAGDKWLGFFVPSSFGSIQKLLDEFHKEESIVHGWRVVGHRSEITKSRTITVEAKIIRAMRCIYSHLENHQEFELVVDQLLDNDYGLPVDMPHNLENIISYPRVRWSCISKYPKDSPFCLFCNGRSFKWEDGDTTYYGGEGFCNDCGAYVGFSNYS
jgi:hypothetical protein